MEQSAASTTTNKTVVKRTSVAPWNAAIMGSKISSSPLGPSSSSAPGASRQQKDPKPARIVSDIALPSTETGQGKTNGLSGSARIMALQHEWEKNLAKSAGGEALSASTSTSQRESSSSSDSSIEATSSRPAVRQAATGPSVNSSPIPLPDYALAHKRTRSEMDGAQETPRNKRQQTSATSVESDKGQQAPMIAQAYRLTEAAALDQCSLSQTPDPPGWNPPMRKPLPGTPARPPQKPPTPKTQQAARPQSLPVAMPQQSPLPNVQTSGIVSLPKAIPPSIQASSQRSRNEPLEVNGKMMDVIDQGPSGNYYYSYYEPDGTRHSGMGALFPTNYKVLDTEDSRFVCPVRDCRKRTDNLRGLAGHFSSSHSKAAFNDNLDGTLSKIGTYKGTSKHLGGMIVSADPLPPNAPPPVETSLSWASQMRNRRSLPKTEPTIKETRPREPRYSMPATVTSTASTSRSSTHSEDSGPINYLNGFLSAKQKVPKRDDIKYMSKLPRLRSLPDIWLHHHHGEELDVHHYACALAYLVGEEVTGADQCKQVDQSKLRSTCRLSDRCIRVPPQMPMRLKIQFSKLLTCVGCRYWSHLQRQVNPCDWNPERREPGAKPPHQRGLNKIRQESDLVVQDSEAEKSSTESVEAEQTQPDTETDPEPRSLGHRQLRQRKETQSATPSTKPVVQARKLDDSADSADPAPKMEGWEFAPGKVLDETESETIAFSTSYLTSAQPITIADDISFNRLRIPPGGTQHWPAEDRKLRYCEVISGKVDLRLGGQSCAVGQGGVFTMRPGMACTAENRRYAEAVLSCHTIDNYSLI